jgi:putative Holliday junction resolvase
MIFKDSNQLNQVPRGRLLGIDVGTKRIGIAICDELQVIATPKLIINRQSNERDFSKIRETILENKIVASVIGLPLQMDGSQQEMTYFAQNFAQNFDEFLEKKLPLFFFEERLSSFEARDFNNSQLSRQGKKSKNKFYDDIAASIILQHFLDELRAVF